MSAHNIALRPQLPPSFTSFYRLFLRATSAAVLNHPKSTRALRRVWRPTFHGAAEVIHRLQSCSQRSPEHKNLESWLKLWNTRSMCFCKLFIKPGLTLVSSVDSTLNLLYSSSQTRGLSHELTTNIARFQSNHLTWAHYHFYSVTSTWKPNMKPTNPAYLPMDTTKVKEKDRAKDKRRQRHVAFERNAWGALGEVVRMAEGRDGVSLGRMSFNERK
jgi:hypothetical protein